MTYVFDTSPLSALFKNFYRGRFPTLWENFDELVSGGEIISTREVLREIEDSPLDNLRDWARDNREIFAIPIAEEGTFVAQIYAIAHFQQNIENKKLLVGGRNADPFVIAKAAVGDGTVITMESLRPNGARIPNICEHFGVQWMSLEGFMEAEGWEF